MSSFATPAIILRRIDFGDYDLIISLFTLNMGKISALAKSAKKSTKRFAGILEPFSVLEVVCNINPAKKRLPILQEAVLMHPFPKISADVKKIAYASYWAELVNEWVEENEKQADVFRLLHYVFNQLNLGDTPETTLSILFQMRFMAISGYSPNITRCGVCEKDLESINMNRITFDVKKGGLVCEKCRSGSTGRLHLSKGTIKQLLWIGSGDFAKAGKIRFSQQAMKESLECLEAFVPYHLGKEPRSLAFLRQIRE